MVPETLIKILNSSEKTTTHNPKMTLFLSIHLIGQILLSESHGLIEKRNFPYFCLVFAFLKML